MTGSHHVQIGSSVCVGTGRKLTLFSGPCVIESRDHALKCAEKLVKITEGRDVQFVFKASYDKANRSSHETFRGLGIDEGLKVLEEIKKTFNIPVISDVHQIEEIAKAKEVLDILQIPAFLCRQTDLIIGCAQTGLPLHVKKGQFMAPWDMANIVKKVNSQNNSKVILCDRGTMFGYANLVVDMRSFQIMRETKAPVSFDASHSVQMPGALGSATGGQREFNPLLARSAVAAGIDALFIETHPDPQSAKSDSTTVFPLDKLGQLLDVLLPLHEMTQKDPFMSNYMSLR